MCNEFRPELQIVLYASGFSKYGLKLSFIALHQVFLKLKSTVKKE